MCMFELCCLGLVNVFVFVCSRTALDCADPNPISFLFRGTRVGHACELVLHGEVCVCVCACVSLCLFITK